MESTKSTPERIIPAAQIHFPEEDIADIQREFADILRTGQLVLGERTRIFEKEFAEYLGAENALAVSSGTAALEIAMRCIGVEGKNVIVPANTFYATAGAVLHAGAKLKLGDIENETFGLDSESAVKLIDDDTAAIVVVHIGGTPSKDLMKLRQICDERGIKLIEDSAHAHGSSVDGKKVGTIGDIGTFSFFPTKVMTSGEGGMVVSNNQDVIKNGRIYRDQGKASGGRNFHTHLGYAWRMSEIHALLGISQLHRLDEFIANRRMIARIYDDGLNSLPGVSPAKIPAGMESNYYKYIAMLGNDVDRESLKAEMKRLGVSLSGEVYGDGLHSQPVFQNRYEGNNSGFSNTDDFCAKHICLPISGIMTEEDAHYVLKKLYEVCRYSGTR